MLFFEDNSDAISIELVGSETLESWRSEQDEKTLGWAVRTLFEGKANQHFFVPTTSDQPERVIAGIGERPSINSIGDLPITLPAGDYRLDNADRAVILGWGLGAYQFAAYKNVRALPRLFVGADATDVSAELNAIALCRDLINTPTSDMLPHHLEGAARKLATRHNATMDVTTGDELLVRGLNIIHAVGRASSSAPRLIDIHWGDPSAPAITLVGGVPTVLVRIGLDFPEVQTLIISTMSSDDTLAVRRPRETIHGATLVVLATGTATWARTREGVLGTTVIG